MQAAGVAAGRGAARRCRREPVGFPRLGSEGGEEPPGRVSDSRGALDHETAHGSAPCGPLFRNTQGVPWTTDATNCRFQTLKVRLGVKYSLYAASHVGESDAGRRRRRLYGGDPGRPQGPVDAGEALPAPLAKPGLPAPAGKPCLSVTCLSGGNGWAGRAGPAAVAARVMAR